MRFVLGLVLGGCAVPTAIGELPEGGSAGSTSEVVPPETVSSAGMSSVSMTSMGSISTTTTTTTTDAPLSGSDTEPVGPGPMRGFSIRWGDIPDTGPDTSSDVGSGTSGIDPDTLLVVITTGDATCDEPFGNLPCGGAWSISFNLPPDSQMPGTYAGMEDLNASASETTEGFPDCGFGAGTFTGTFILTTVDTQTVSGRIENGDEFLSFDPNVAFDAPRCP